MANRVEALGVSRSADAPKPARHPMTSHFRARIRHDERLPRWLILIPLGPLVIVTLLIISLSRIVLAPSLAPTAARSGADAEVHVHVPVADELHATERTLSFGAALTR
jgi:hypothetical protein